MTGHDLVVAARQVVTGGALVPARVGVRDGVIRAVVPWEHELLGTETVTLPVAEPKPKREPKRSKAGRH